MIYSYADLKGKIKVGDSVKAVAGKKNPCDNLKDDGSNTGKITEVKSDRFYIDGCAHFFVDGSFLDLIPIETTWETLKTGDEVEGDGVYTVLARIDDLVFLSEQDEPKETGPFWTISEMKEKYTIIQPKQEEEEVLMTVAEIAEKLNISNLKIVK